MKKHEIKSVLRALNSKGDITIKNNRITLYRSEKTRIESGNKTLGKLDFLSKQGFAVTIKNS